MCLSQVGTTFVIPFVVYDDSTPTQFATVTRRVTIVDPCSEPNKLCSDGVTCSMACESRGTSPVNCI